MTSIADQHSGVTIGVDTHKDAHVAAVLDHAGRVVDTRQFSADRHGHCALHDWAIRHGEVVAVGIEGTGSYGAGLHRHLAGVGLPCIEVNHTNRQHRRRHGKSDTADAIGAARAVQSGQADGRPRGNDGLVEALRTIRVALRSAIRSRSQAINQLRALVVTAPEPLAQRFRHLTRDELVSRASGLRPSADSSATTATKHAMRSLARRIRVLDVEIEDLRAERDRYVWLVAPIQLMDEHGVGPDVASDLLIAFGDNPDRIRSESSFAALCGVSPVDASSGKSQRHRLNRGGDRQANKALYRIVTCRMASDERTQRHVAQTIARGKTKREAIRILKRYVARHIWRLLQQHPPRLDNP
ncbi:IS110 family transposase [Euzebya tangerina]|uniref:IS110 family transposase n=1 Tax=Euzebya tangerina TaxID=591198 RepID=UPI000E32213C|nr:IS110 family transposase [Euzebya tangerina]